LTHAMVTFPGNLQPKTEQEVYAHFRKVLDSSVRLRPRSVRRAFFSVGMRMDTHASMVVYCDRRS
jgi:hypothetical protein